MKYGMMQMHNYKIIYKNIKKMYLRVKGDKIIISCPKYTSKKTIDEFIANNKAWILMKLNEYSSNLDPSFVNILGKRYDLVYTVNQEVKIEKGILYTPKDEVIFKHFLKEYTSSYLIRRFDILSNQIGLQNMNLKLAFYKSKWGSCTPSKRLICLNLNLVYASLECIDAIIFHELAHMFVLNHSKAFYDVLLNWCPDYKETIKKLKVIKPFQVEENICK